MNVSTQIPLNFVSGYALQDYSTAEEGIISALNNGYQYWYIDLSLSTEIPSKWDDERIDKIKGLIKKYKVYPILHGNFKVPLSSDVFELREAAISYTKNEINLANKLSAPLIIHGGAIVEPRLVIKIKKEAINNFLSSLIELRSYANDRDVTLYLENLSNYKNYHPFHYIFTHDEEFSHILPNIGLKFFLDLGHANIGNASPIEIFNKYHLNIAGMSFSNNNGLQDQHLSLMKGTIDYKKILEAIHIKSWKGIVAFETRDLSPNKSILELETIFRAIQS